MTAEEPVVLVELGMTAEPFAAQRGFDVVPEKIFQPFAELFQWRNIFQFPTAGTGNRRVFKGIQQ